MVRSWRLLLLALPMAASGLWPAPSAAADSCPRPTPTRTPPPPGWRLVWADEFNGHGAPDPSKWSYHVGNGFNPGLNDFHGWGNGEWEWYRPENCSVSGGQLVIRADYHETPTNIAGRDWYQRSCRITTQGKHAWKYGRIEARIAAPHAAGAWPAFWMLGASSDGTVTPRRRVPLAHYDIMGGNWSSCGEIDILEKRNYENQNTNNAFWDMRIGVFPWADGQNANYASVSDVEDMTRFHVYAIEWDPQFIRWFVDGRQTHVMDITPETLEEFHKPFFIVMNLALAGSFPQMPPNAAEFPLSMRVDYVRVYKRR